MRRHALGVGSVVGALDAILLVVGVSRAAADEATCGATYDCAFGISDGGTQTSTNGGADDGVAGDFVVGAINAAPHPIARVMLTVVIITIERLQAFARTGHGGEGWPFGGLHAAGEQKGSRRGHNGKFAHGTLYLSKIRCTLNAADGAIVASPQNDQKHLNAG
jgi:hypothetical protein